MAEENHRPLAPVAEDARIDVMDILRGFALMGIVFMNVEWFNRSSTNIRTFDETLTGMDHAIGWLIRVFVEGKFYKLFALLFGMGFAVMLIRARNVDRPFGAWFTRRMLVLMLIGLVHQVFIWDGDILHDYAFAGLVFLGGIYIFESRWMSRLNTPKSFLKIGIVWLLMPFVVLSAAGIGLGTRSSHDDVVQRWQLDVEIAAAVEQRLSESIREDGDSLQSVDAAESLEEESSADARKERQISYRAEAQRRRAQRAELESALMSGDSYLQATRYRLSTLPGDAVKTVFFTFILLIPLFLVGYWFIASGVLKNHRQHQQLFSSLALIGLVFGTILSTGGLLILQHPAGQISASLSRVGFWLFNLAQLLLAAGYLGLVVTLVGNPGWHRVLKRLAPFGRMALTNYIMQSVIMVLLFHGYAGGLYGEISRAPQMLIVIAIIAVQVPLSAWWLTRYRFGPLEWLWRSATYLSWQRLKV